MVCQRWSVKDGVWQSGVWKMVCDKVVCERWCGTKWCERWCVKDGVSRMVCERWCVTKWCERWCVKDGVWQSGVKDGVSKMVWKMVCQRWWVTKLCVKDGVSKIVWEPAQSSSARLCVLRLSHESPSATQKPDAAQRRPRTRQLLQKALVYCSCHTKASRGPAKALCTAPATRKPAAAQRRPRAHQLLQKALCILRLPHESQLRPSGAHARTSSSRRLCVLRLPHESSSRRLCVLHLPHESHELCCDECCVMRWWLWLCDRIAVWGIGCERLCGEKFVWWSGVMRCAVMSVMVCCGEVWGDLGGVRAGGAAGWGGAAGCGRSGGCKGKNKNPTQWCGEQPQQTSENNCQTKDKQKKWYSRQWPQHDSIVYRETIFGRSPRSRPPKKNDNKQKKSARNWTDKWQHKWNMTNLNDKKMTNKWLRTAYKCFPMFSGSVFFIILSKTTEGFLETRCPSRIDLGDFRPPENICQLKISLGLIVARGWKIQY